MPQGQNLTLLLLSIIAPVGALDAVVFHVWRFRLALRPASRLETVTHIVRSLTLGAVVGILARFEPAGAWFWAVAGLLLFDFLNNLADAFLEGESRRELGGVPRVEYLVHIAGASWVGAASLSFLVRGWEAAWLPTGLGPPRVAVPWALQVNAGVIAVGSFALAALETAMLTSQLRGRRGKGAR